MSDLVERLRTEQGRLQRVYDSRQESVKRRRAIKYRLKMMQESADEIERLRADCKAKDRTIETQQQYLDNKDSVIAGMNKMITKLEGDLEVMRLQRDATQSSRCPNCERLRAANKSLKAAFMPMAIEYYLSTDDSDVAKECIELLAALREDEDE